MATKEKGIFWPEQIRNKFNAQLTALMAATMATITLILAISSQRLLTNEEDGITGKISFKILIISLQFASFA